MAQKSYKINHTAEAIDLKLNLINENKNLLPYPYKATFLAGLEDVGDGSVLTVTAHSRGQSFLLTPTGLLLPEGTYTASIEVADLVDITEVITNPGFELEITGATVDAAGQFTVDGNTPISVSLKMPSAEFATNLVIKPMIRKADDTDTTWVPYMKDIGNYVDERFNSTNTRIRVLEQQLTDLIESLSLAYTDNKLHITLDGSKIGESVSTAVLSE